jgi:hypothetical protein
MAQQPGRGWLPTHDRIGALPQDTGAPPPAGDDHLVVRLALPLLLLAQIDVHRPGWAAHPQDALAF